MSFDIPQGPVVTQGLVESMVHAVEYHKFQDTNVIMCALKLTNGFTVTGMSACLPTTEFDPNAGMAYAREQAEGKLREMLGFMVYDLITTRAATIAVASALNALKESVHGQ